jgi:hypothetical protein
LRKNARGRLFYGVFDTDEKMPGRICGPASSDPGGIRTHDRQLRRLLLYPTELRDHVDFRVQKYEIPKYLQIYFVFSCFICIGRPAFYSGPGVCGSAAEPCKNKPDGLSGLF